VCRGHASQGTVATCNRRGCPLEGLGMLGCPALPGGAHLRPAPPGAGMPLALLLHGLQGACEWGLLTGTTGTGPWRWPGHHRPEQLVHPVLPARAQRSGLSSALHPLPPHIDQGRDPREWCADLGQRVVLRWEPMRCQQGFKRDHCRAPPRFHRGGALSDRVHTMPGGQEQREMGKMGPRGTANVRPALPLGCMVLHPVRCQRRLHPAGRGCLGCGQARSGWRHGLLGWPQTTAKGQRRALGPLRTAGEHLGHAQAIATGVRQREPGFGSGTDQGRDRRAQRLEPGSHSTAPGVIGALSRHRCPHQGATGPVHTHAPQARPKGCVHRPDAGAERARLEALWGPRPTGCPARALPPLRPPSQGAGRAPQMGLKGQTAAKRADRVDPNAAWQANEHESGNNPADEPVSAFRGFPSPRLRVAVSVPCGPELAMPAAGGKSRTLSKPSAARLPVCTNRVDNPHTVGPPCHGGGPRSAGWLKS